jgi:Asp/Glu/hydantoin racemase
MPEVTYADALRRPTPTHPKGDSTKMDRDKTQQPAQPTERPIDILPCDRPSDVQLRQQADTILAMEKNLQLLQERVASLKTKFDEVLAIIVAFCT